MNTIVTPTTSITSTFATLEAQRRQQKEDPYLSSFFATTYIALTFIILAYGSLMGFGGILVMYAIWLPKITYKGTFLLRPSRDVIFILLMPVLAIISVAWSDYPSTTVHSSFEYASLVVCTIIIAKTVRLADFIRGAIVGSCLALIASLINGTFGVDPMTGSYTLVGLFGSKNMIGLFAEIGIILSILNIYIRQHMFQKVIFALIPLGICVITLYLSKSASSVLTLAFTLAVLFAAVVISKLPRAFRMITLISISIFTGLVVTVGTAYEVHDLVLKSFGKDSTLTGRTYLWEEGIKSGWETPILGHGYQAFWVIGRQKAERLWMKFDVQLGSIGFHFHNLFIETFVEMGVVGFLLLLSLMLTNCTRSISCILKNGMTIEGAYALCISFMYLSRSLVEVDLIGTFMIGPVLFFSVIVRLATFQKKLKNI